MMKQCARTLLTLAAALCIAVAAWGQNTPTQRGVVANSNVTKVNATDITTNGQVVGVGEGTTVTVNVTPPAANKVARVTD